MRTKEEIRPLVASQQNTMPVEEHSNSVYKDLDNNNNSTINEKPEVTILYPVNDLEEYITKCGINNSEEIELSIYNVDKNSIHLEVKECIPKNQKKRDLFFELKIYAEKPLSGPVKEAVNFVRIRASHLIKNDALMSQVDLSADAETKYTYDSLVKLAKYLYVYIPFEPAPINTNPFDALKKEDESAQEHEERYLQSLEWEKNIIQHHLDKNIKTSIKFMWGLLLLFVERYTSEDNIPHRRLLEQRIEELKNIDDSNHMFVGNSLPGEYTHNDGSLFYRIPGRETQDGRTITNPEYVNLGNLVTITAIGKNDEGGAPYVELTFVSNGELKKLHCDESEISDSRKILGLSDKGLIVKSPHIKHIIDYFSDVKIYNRDKIKTLYVSTKNGFKDDYKTFTYGDCTITSVKEPDGSYKRYEYIDKEVSKKYEIRGTLERQIEGIKAISKRDPVVHFKMHAGMASPFIELFNMQQSIVVFHIGDKRSGKGITTYLIACFWGNPSNRCGLLTPSGTIAGMPQVWEEQSSTIHALTEMSMLEVQAKKGTDINKDLVYMYSENSSGAKSNKGHKNFKPKTWFGVFILNGENSPLTSHDNGGQLLRMIEIKKSMISDRKAVDLFKSIIFEEGNQGHIAPLVMKKVLEAGKAQVTIEYREYVEKFVEVLGDSNAMYNMSETLAVFAIAGKYLNKVLEEYGVETLDPFQTTLEMATPYLVDVNPDEDIGIKAARVFKSWFDGNYKKFNPPEDIVYNAGDGKTAVRQMKSGYVGFYKRNYIDVFPDVFDKVIERDLGFPSAITIADSWVKLGLAEKNVAKSLGKNKDGKQLGTKVIRIFEDKFHEVLFTPEEMQKLAEEAAAEETEAEAELRKSSDIPHEPTAYDKGLEDRENAMMYELYKKFHDEEKFTPQGAPYIKEWYVSFMQS